MSRSIFTIVLVLLLFGGVSAGIIKVPQNYATIQAGIDAAVKGDTVLVAAGTYYENISFKGKAITVASYYLVDSDTTHINNTIIDGSKPSHADSGSVVYFVSGEDTTSVLCGFTITGGTGTFYVLYSAQAGGGIFCDNSGCTILANKIINNTITGPAARGAGVVTLPMGSPAYIILRDNQILHNSLTADSLLAGGGGVNLWCNGRLVNNQISFNSIVQNSTHSSGVGGGVCCRCPTVIMEFNKITYNSVVSYSVKADPDAWAGGIFINGSQGRLTKNEVSYNTVWVNSGRSGCGAGMGIRAVADPFIVEANIIRENSVTHGNGFGGGANIALCSPLLINNIVVGNSATNGGGFIIPNSNAVQLINNTIINNHATDGGGITIANSSNVSLMNNIIWANQASQWNPAIAIWDSNIRVAYCDIQGGWTGTGNINVDPLFLDAKFHLSEASPCIDKGNPDAAYNDPENVNNLGFALFPARGTVRNDMGAFGGPGANKTSTDIKHDRQANEAKPNTFVLFQNYPNPFNATTTIDFDLPNSAFVTLKVYNLLGREVATLAEQKLAAGKHKLDWDASGFVSGVYFYKIEAGSFSMTRKMLLVR